IAVYLGLGLVPVQTRFGNHVQKCLPLADVPALGEVGSKQGLHDSILKAFLVGQPDEPVGVKCVWGSLDSVECKTDSFRLPNCNHLGVEFQRALPASKFGGAIFLAAD